MRSDHSETTVDVIETASHGGVGMLLRFSQLFDFDRQRVQALLCLLLRDPEVCYDLLQLREIFPCTVRRSSSEKSSIALASASAASSGIERLSFSYN